MRANGLNRPGKVTAKCVAKFKREVILQNPAMEFDIKWVKGGRMHTDQHIIRPDVGYRNVANDRRLIVSIKSYGFHCAASFSPTGNAPT